MQNFYTAKNLKIGSTLLSERRWGFNIW